MKRLLLVFAMPTLLFVACQAAPTEVAYEAEDIYPVQEYIQVPPPTSEDQALYDEPPERSSLSGLAQHIVNSGYFGGEHIWESQGEERRTAPITYTNTALGLAYHVDAQCIETGFFSELSDSPAWDYHGLLMRAHTFGEQFFLFVIDGCGEEEVERMAQSDLESIIKMYSEHYAWLREYWGEEYEENLAHSVIFRNENEEWHRENMGDDFENMLWPITPDEYENIEFWPVEYKVAGRVFAGLQINFILPEAGWNSGATYLFSQVSDDVAIFIAIRSEAPAGAVARQHMSRFYEFHSKS